MKQSELDWLVRLARNHKPTPRERFEQRVSFVYGQMTPGVMTKDQVRAYLAEHMGVEL